MGLLISADFNKKLDIKLYRFDPKIKDTKYHAEIFSEMFVQFRRIKTARRSIKQSLTKQ